MARLAEEIREDHRPLLERLKAQAIDVNRLAEGLTEQELLRRVDPDRWSLKELACHLMVIQAVFSRRVAAMLEQEDPILASYDPDEDAEFDRLKKRPAAAILSQFQADRAAFIRLLDSLGAAQWRRSGQHPEFDRYDIRFLVEYLLYHEAHHIYQMFWLRKDLAAFALDGRV
ncbi:MAG: DinB family protein [Bryobacteraceae bacterium]|nr:DinB family protein [Bryobacteraceae bacterium]